MERDSDPIQLDDKRIRVVLAPLLGIGIGTTTGLYQGAGPATPVFWGATAWFILIAFVIWEGNRFFWVRLQSAPDWLDNPVLRLLLLIGGSLTWTVLASVGLQVAWAALRGERPDWALIRASTMVTVVAVAFVVHTYETVYLIHQRRRERDTRSTLEVARAKAELAALNAQVDPHFVFNSLHTIIELNDQDPSLATEFAITLADVYRYVVQHGKRDLVTLAEELALLEKYAELLRTRFGDGISVRLPAPAPHHKDLRIPPVALQVLLENVMKHNRYGDRAPLEVSVELSGRSVVVRNQKRPLAKPARGARTGLINLDQRCKLICGPGIEIREDSTSFAVVVPLL